MEELLKKAVYDYFLKSDLNPDVIQSIKQIGEGVHGRAYEICYLKNDRKKSMILKSIMPKGFGHEFVSDRALVLTQAASSYNKLPNHVKSYDLIAVCGRRHFPIGTPDEFYLLIEKAEGYSYYDNLDIILENQGANVLDYDKALTLSIYLSEIHQKPQMDVSDQSAIYRRKIRETLGHSECILGVIDEYPEESLNELDLKKTLSLCLNQWHKLRNRHERLRIVHGDFHPGNIIFDKGKEFKLLDRSRGEYGEPADDISCILINYYMYYVIGNRKLKDFKKLTETFVGEYLQRTGDDELLGVLPLFMFFRRMVVSNPRFFPKNSKAVRDSIVNYTKKMLETPITELDTLLESFDN